MKSLLFLLSALAFLGGAAILANAASAIHEIEAFILFLIFAVFLSGAGIIEAISKFKSKSAANES